MSADSFIEGDDMLRAAIEGNRLAQVGLVINDHLDAIASLFRPGGGVKLTLLVRSPKHPDGCRDLVHSNDDLRAAIAALELKAVAR